MKVFSDEERRNRLARRQGIASQHRFADLAAATEAMTAWHATESATVHLALHARVDDLEISHVETALYQEKHLVKQLAMRRTLWAFPREILPAVWGSAAARVAATQRKQLTKAIRDSGIAGDADKHVDEVGRKVVEALDNHPQTLTELRESVPELNVEISVGTPGKKWSAVIRMAGWVVAWLGAEGRIVRGNNAGHWRLNKPTWVRTEQWLPQTRSPMSADEGYAELVTRYLRTFGPATEKDIVWWLGATKTAVRTALRDIDAEQVGLERDRTAWVVPGDTEPDEAPEPWAALLPTLDPTVMGWKEREFYLTDADVPFLFDSNGNAGNTAWCDGRVVGAWAQDDDGVVHVLSRRPLDGGSRDALDAEAARLTAWLDGTRIVNVYSSLQMKQAKLP